MEGVGLTENEKLLGRILEKCVEDGDCLMWQGAMADGSCPSIKVGGKARNARRLYYELTTGRPLPAGKVASATCGCGRCLSHVKPQTIAQVLAGAVERGAYGVRHAAKVAATKRKSAKFSEEVIRRVRESDEVGTKLAAEIGMDQSYLSRVRRGMARKDYANPFASLLG